MTVVAPRPRPRRPRQPPPQRSGSGSTQARQEAIARAALWSASFHRFFGARYGRDQLPAALRPMSCGETSHALAELDQRSDTVHRCICQMLASGYVPDRHNATQFQTMVLKTARRRVPRAPEREIDDLRIAARREYLGPYAALAPPPEPALPPGARGVTPLPTEVVFRGDVFTLRKDVLVPRALDAVAELVHPLQWPKLGPFWEQVEMVDENVVHEVFVVDWNAVRLNRFDVHLRVRMGNTPDSVRTDYSLMYEANQELLVDEGYGEAKRAAGHEGWTRYRMEKTLKFASSFLNLLSPAIVAMFLESHSDSLAKIFMSPPRRRAVRHGH